MTDGHFMYVKCLLSLSFPHSKALPNSSLIFLDASHSNKWPYCCSNTSKYCAPWPIEFTFPFDMFPAMTILILIIIPFTVIFELFCAFRCNMFFWIPSRFSLLIPIGAPYWVRGFDCVPSDDGVCPESKTDTGHICAQYLLHAASYIVQTHLRFHMLH